jgi:hypothetical protein
MSACAVTKSQTNPDVALEVSYCKLVDNPDRYHEKLVRVSGVYERGFEKSYLYDPECRSNQSQMWVSHHKSFVLDGDSEEARKNRTISDFGQWSVTAVGRFVRAKGPVRFGHLGCCRYELGLVRIEESEKLPDN